MPLQDWTDESGWDNFHQLWINRLYYDIRPRLPGEFRAYLGSMPALTVSVTERPDVAVRQWQEEPPPHVADESPNGSTAECQEPDQETATMMLDSHQTQQAIYVSYRGRLAAAIELISPRNKDRPSARAYYVARYLGYLRDGADLLLIDILPRPLAFSFADSLAEELQIAQPPTPSPLVASYRVGEPAATGGRMLAIWRHALAVNEPLPAMPLPLTTHAALEIDLEKTYMQAAADAYLT